jgi:hypothetical protein
MKRAILAFLAIACVSFSIVSCSTLKPFTQDDFDQITGRPTTSQGK